MAERDDGTPRRLPVVVEIRTFGERCRDRRNKCPFLSTVVSGTRHWCELHRAWTGREETFVALRVPACLALDEPDRSPAEAQAHGLGSQP